MNRFVLVASLLAVFVGNGFTQDFVQWDLPEGASQRLGKGWIRQIQYSPDGNRLAAAGSIGVWIYDTKTNQEVDLLSGHTRNSQYGGVFSGWRYDSERGW